MLVHEDDWGRPRMPERKAASMSTGYVPHSKNKKESHELRELGSITRVY